MKELNLSEIYFVSGGYDHKGYTFSFVVESALTGFAYGGLTFPLVGTYGMLVGAAIGASYATLMMGTTALDNYCFPEEKQYETLTL